MDEPAWSELFRFDVEEDPGSAEIGYIEGVRANFSPNVDVRVGSAVRVCASGQGWLRRAAQVFPSVTDAVTDLPRDGSDSHRSPTG